MSRIVTWGLCIVGLSALALTACGDDKSDKSAAAPAKASTTTTTTVLTAPPTTVLGPPESYALPPSWPTDPAQADPSTADLTYVQHVVDAYDAVEGLAFKAMAETESVNDEAQAFIAEYAYNEEMVGLEIEACRNIATAYPGQILPGQIASHRPRALSRSHLDALSLETTLFQSDVRAAAKPRRIVPLDGHPTRQPQHGHQSVSLAALGVRTEAHRTRNSLQRRGGLMIPASHDPGRCMHASTLLGVGSTDCLHRGHWPQTTRAKVSRSGAGSRRGIST